jgi:hypothetical protein
MTNASGEYLVSVLFLVILGFRRVEDKLLFATPTYTVAAFWNSVLDTAKRGAAPPSTPRS